MAAKLKDCSTCYQVPPRLALVRADVGDKNSFVDHESQTYQWQEGIEQKQESAKGFVEQVGR